MAQRQFYCRNCNHYHLNQPQSPRNVRRAVDCVYPVATIHETQSQADQRPHQDIPFAGTCHDLRPTRKTIDVVSPSKGTQQLATREDSSSSHVSTEGKRITTTVSSKNHHQFDEENIVKQENSSGLTLTFGGKAKETGKHNKDKFDHLTITVSQFTVQEQPKSNLPVTPHFCLHSLGPLKGTLAASSEPTKPRILSKSKPDLQKSVLISSTLITETAIETEPQASNTISSRSNRLSVAVQNSQTLPLKPKHQQICTINNSRCLGFNCSSQNYQVVIQDGESRHRKRFITKL